MFSAYTHAFIASIGILGLGHFIWSLIKSESPKKHSGHFQEHWILTLGISWFVGYFMYEGILLLTALCQIFRPPVLLMIESILTFLGGYWLYFQRKKIRLASSTHLIEKITFLSLVGFMFFLNLYPSRDVDSLAFYFATIQQWLEAGGKNFSRFDDIRRTVPIGENYIYALGFALQPHSTFFQQLIHAMSKIMLMSCIYGGLRSLNAGIFALLGLAFMVVDDQIVGSGIHEYVRINMPICASVFLMGYSLFLFFTHHRIEFLALGILSAFNFMSCKYLGLSYLACLASMLILWFSIFRKWNNIIPACRQFPKTLIILMVGMSFASIPYLYNLFVTGTPLYPASVGPFSSPYFDPPAVALARDWHFHLNLMDALKNLSAFMVWPGVLASKILLPIALLSSLFMIAARPNTQIFFNAGMSFFVMSLIVVILTQTYMVFEMRYYRYGIGLYVSAAALLITFIFQTIMDRSKFLQKAQQFIALLLVFCLCLWCVKYSLKVTTSSRPTPLKIMAFLTGTTSVKEIINTSLQKPHAIYQYIQEKHIDDKNLGFFISFSWPQTYYPIKGKNIGFLNAGAFPSVTYFNDGLFAQALLDTHINVIINGLVKNADYPLKGGAVYSVITQCVETSSSSEGVDIIYLSQPCLETLAKKKNLQKGQDNLKEGLKSLEKLPRYEPFNPPSYGGPSELIN